MMVCRGLGLFAPAVNGFASARAPDRFRLQVFGIDRADDAVAIAVRHEEDRDRPGHHQAVLDGLVAVAVTQGDVVLRQARHEDDAVGARRAVGDGVGAMRAEYAGGILLALADRPAVVEQRADRRHPDRKIRAKQVLAEVVEEDLRHRRLEKGRAAQVPGRAERIFMHVRLREHRGEHGRQQVLAIALDRGLDPTRDERGRVLGQPDELIRQLERAQRNRGYVAALAKQESRRPVIARTKRAQHSLCATGFIEIGVDDHAADQRIGIESPTHRRRRARAGSRRIRALATSRPAQSRSAAASFRLPISPYTTRMLSGDVGAAFAIVFPPVHRSHDTNAVLVTTWQTDATSSRFTVDPPGTRLDLAATVAWKFPQSDRRSISRPGGHRSSAGDAGNLMRFIGL